LTGALYRLRSFCIRRRFVVIAVWVAATIAVVAVSQQLGNKTKRQLLAAGPRNSQQAASTLQKSFPAIANGTSPILFHARSAS